MKKPEIDYWISKMLGTHKSVSDLNITAGKPLQVEADGVLLPVKLDPPIRELTPFQTEVFALNLIGHNERLMDDLVSKGSCDLSYTFQDKARFRVNIFTQRGRFSIVMRKLESSVPTIESMQLPETFFKIASELNGLVLFTGATGTGKTTSLAALLDEINAKRAVHVVTLEDPIEFVHTHKKATFNQRELGDDFIGFSSGMRAALRQAPKVILVGEMRDRETMEIGLSAAETGHLVFSTLHTIDAGQAINRIIGMFEQEEQQMIRNRLADTIRWIVGQRLLPKKDGGRVALFEILRTSLRVKDLIINGETEEKTFYGILKEGSAWDMRTFDQHVMQLFSEGVITEQTALRYCSHRSEVSRGLDHIKAVRGEATTGLTGLEMEAEEKDKMQWY